METKTEQKLAGIRASLQEKKDGLSTFIPHGQIDVTEDLSQVAISSLIRPSFHQRQIISNRYLALQISLKEHGFVGGIFVSESTNHVIDGWQRVTAWECLDNKTIPCFYVKCTERQERELHLRLNTQAAQFDLGELGLSFSGLNLAKDFGFSETDLTPRSKKSTLDSLDAIRKQQTETKKFTATLQNSCYEELKEIKDENRFSDWADVIDLLIKNYHATISNKQ